MARGRVLLGWGSRLGAGEGVGEGREDFFGAGGWRIFYVVLNEVIDGGGRGRESVQSDKIFSR
jgi:hypothetical protein